MDTAAISLNQLESHLWEAANILRGPVDAADFKSYVFPLLFFKRISDAHDEEYQAALKESGGDEEYAQFPQNYRFQVPEDCHWSDVRAVTTNVGEKLQKAMRGIEKANPDTLYGIFGDAQWTNKDRLSDSLLRDLIEHFSRISLGNQATEGDILGQSYEYLIKKFADATNKKAGEFYTPRPVVRLMVNILDPKEGESIYDPACGTGGMLLEAILHVKASGTRQNVFDNFCRYQAAVAALGAHATQWVDGSFVDRSRLDPEDVDVVNFCEFSVLNSLPPDARTQIAPLLDGRESTKRDYKTHTFLETCFPAGHPYAANFENRRKYWRDWFSRPQHYVGPKKVEASWRGRKGIVQMIVGDGKHCPAISGAT